MESIRKNLPLIAFSCFFLKSLIFPISYPEIGMMLVLGAIASVFEFKSHNKKLKELEQKLEMEDKALLLLSKKVDDLNTHLASVKMAQGMRSMSIK